MTPHQTKEQNNVIIIYETLIRFLKEKRLYRKFLNNFNDIYQYDWRVKHLYSDSKTVFKFVQDCFSTYDASPIKTMEKLFLRAFLWRTTQEGDDFWSSVVNYECFESIVSKILENKT